MSADIIVRRFEVRAADQGTLDELYLALREAVDKLPVDLVKAEIDKIGRPPMVTVRLQGAASAIATVRDSIPRVQGVQLHRDWLDVPAAAPPAGGALRGGLAPPEDEDKEVYPDQRALMRIDPEGRSRREKGSGARAVVAVVDSGIMVDHPAFQDNLWTMKINGRDVHGARCMGGEQDYDLSDQDGHGTMLAGTILGTANAVKGLEIMAVKFFDVITQPTAANAAQAIRFAVGNGAHIINLSFDLGIGSTELEQAIRSACQAGALVVMAAGNTGSNNDDYPLTPAHYAKGCPDSTIVVMATDLYDEKPTLTNFGSKTVDLAAPGVKIETTRTFRPIGGLSRKYGRYTGTSAAAAMVTGAAALLKSQNPNRNANDLKRCLMESVDELPWLKCVSRGRLHLGHALSCKP